MAFPDPTLQDGMTTRLLVDEGATWEMLGARAAAAAPPATTASRASVGSNAYVAGRRSETIGLLGGTTGLLVGSTTHLLAGNTSGLLLGEGRGRFGCRRSLLILLHACGRLMDQPAQCRSAALAANGPALLTCTSCHTPEDLSHWPRISLLQAHRP